MRNAKRTGGGWWLAAVLFAGTVMAEMPSQSGGDWTFTRANAAMTGVSPVELRTPLTLAWQFKMMDKPKGQSEMLISSVVVRAGKVYGGCKDGKFFCLELATGKKLWEAGAKGAFDGAAAFSGPLVIAGCQDGFVYAWNAETGSEAWKYETMAEIHAAANIWTDPTTKKDKVIIGSYDYSVYSLDAQTGKKDWSAETGYYINGGSAVADGKVVFGGCDAVLHVHDVATGKELKQIEVGSYIGNNVALADDVVYVSHYGNKIEAYSMKDGMKVWEYADRDFEYYAAPAVYETIVIVGGRDKRLHGLDRATGRSLWEFRARDRIDSSAVICGGKSAIFGCDDGYVYIVDIKTGTEVWHYEVGAPVRSSAAVAGDWVVFGADDGVVYAFKNGSAGAGG